MQVSIWNNNASNMWCNNGNKVIIFEWSNGCCIVRCVLAGNGIVTRLTLDPRRRRLPCFLRTHQPVACSSSNSYTFTYISLPNIIQLCTFHNTFHFQQYATTFLNRFHHNVLRFNSVALYKFPCSSSPCLKCYVSYFSFVFVILSLYFLFVHFVVCQSCKAPLLPLSAKTFPQI